MSDEVLDPDLVLEVGRHKFVNDLLGGVRREELGAEVFRTVVVETSEMAVRFEEKLQALFVRQRVG